MADNGRSAPGLVQVRVMLPLQAHAKEQLNSTCVSMLTSTSGPGVTAIRKGSARTNNEQVEIFSQK